MKIFLILFILQLCLINLSAQTTANDPLLAEAAQLNTNVVKLYAEGKFKDALIDAKKANAIYVNTAGKDDLRTATSFVNLAQLYYQLKEKKEAKSAFNDALDIYEKNTPLSAANEKRYADLLETVAMFEGADGDVSGAEKKLTKALELREKIYGPNAKETADVLYSLAQIYRVSGQYEKALPPLLRSIDIRTDKNGKVENAPVEMWSTMTCLLGKFGRESEAKELGKRFRADNDIPPAHNASRAELIKAGILNGKAKYLAIPSYPSEARAKGIEGKVTVQVLIDESGKVTFACGMSGPIELHQAAEAAAYASKFSPTKLSGQPVKVSGVITYNFQR